VYTCGLISNHWARAQKIYIGSAVDLSNRLKDYYRISFISRKSRGNSNIYNALISHGYSSFSLTILEHINITNLSKVEARKLILEREQYFIDKFMPEYNILKKAGSLLGYKHTEETIAKICEAMTGENHPLFGKTGENSPNFGKNHSSETKLKMSLAKGTVIYLYDSHGSLVNTFPSARKASEHFNVSCPTILKYVRNGRIFKNQWFFSTFLIRQE
jgi:group I intron endonuclease